MSAGPPSDSGPISGIDPRIRARRIAVRRGEGRRRLQWLGVAAALTAVAVAATGLALSPLLDVDVMAVEGVERAGRDDVIDATGIRPGDPLVTADLAAGAAGVRALPWVADATLSRSWPGTVEVSVVERTPAAAIAAEGQVALVDVDGRVLDLAEAGRDAVVLIDGLTADLVPGRQLGAPARAAIALAAGIPLDLRERVARIIVTPRRHLELELVVGEAEPALVRFGDGSQLDEKLRAFVTVAVSADLTGLDVLDLEVPSAPALTRR